MEQVCVGGGHPGVVEQAQELVHHHAHLHAPPHPARHAPPAQARATPGRQPQRADARRRVVMRCSAPTSLRIAVIAAFSRLPRAPQSNCSPQASPSERPPAAGARAARQRGWGADAHLGVDLEHGLVAHVEGAHELESGDLQREVKRSDQRHLPPAATASGGRGAGPARSGCPHDLRTSTRHSHRRPAQTSSSPARERKARCSPGVGPSRVGGQLGGRGRLTAP